MDYNLLNPLVTFVVGLFAFILYSMNRREQVRTAATLILNEIRNTEKLFEEFAVNKDFLRFTPASISTDSWSRYQHLISPKLDEDQRQEIIRFFDNANAFKQIISEWQTLHLTSLLSKTTKMQEKLIDIADEVSGRNDEYEKQKNNVLRLINPDPYWFEPDAFRIRMEPVIAKRAIISTTTTGQTLKKLAKGKFL